MGFVEPASKKPEHALPADDNLERNRRIFSNLYRFAWRRVEMVRFILWPAFNSSLVDSTYECTTRQNATLTSQGRQGGVE